MSDSDWDIPSKLQPNPADYAYDLDRTLSAVVTLHSYVPEDAFTARTLGPERGGSGVVIDESGVIVTIGYLVTEAETIWINTNDGRAIPGHALAVDQETGFGLVQALGRLDLPALEIGDTDTVKIGDDFVIAAGGGRKHAMEVKLAGREEFAGYWEYALDDAFYTGPAHPNWGGTGLIGEDGKLYGIGSLILQQGHTRAQRADMNMVVPIGLLPPILPDLLAHGRANRPSRPWLGMLATENDDSVYVAGVTDSGPADRAGIQAGDRIVSVEDDEPSDLFAVWQRIWAVGTAGAQVRLRVSRNGRMFDVAVQSADRASFLKAPMMH